MLVQYSETNFNSVVCESGNKIDREFAGGSVTVLNAEGSKVATSSIPSAARELSADEAGSDAGGCEWTVSLPAVPDSDIYTVQLALPGGYTDESDVSRSDLQSEDWTVEFSVSN